MNPLLDALAGPTGLKLALALLHFVWQGVLIAAVAAVLMHVVGRRSPQRRYAIGVAGMALMAVAPVVTFCLVTPPETPSIEPVPLTDVSDLLVDLEQLDALLMPLDAAASDAGEIAPPAVRLSWPERLRLIQPHAVLLWLAGSLLCGLRLVVGARASVRCRRGRRSLPDAWLATVATTAERIGIRSPRVFVSDRVAEAIAVGLLRPMVLLPAAWIGRIPPDVLEAVLAHEFAHLRRHDLWVNLFQRVVESLLFYHPAVWWLSRRIRVEREYCCDETAAAAVAGRAAYARALEYVATERVAGGRTELFQAALVAGMRGGDSMALLNRVRRVLGVEDRPPFRPRLSEGLLVLAVPAALWAGIATVGSALAQEKDSEGAARLNPAAREGADEFETEEELLLGFGPDSADTWRKIEEQRADDELHDALRGLREELKSLRSDVEKLGAFRKLEDVRRTLPVYPDPSDTAKGSAGSDVVGTDGRRYRVFLDSATIPGGHKTVVRRLDPLDDEAGHAMSVDAFSEGSFGNQIPSEVAGKDGRRYRAVMETIVTTDGKQIHVKRLVPVDAKDDDATDRTIRLKYQAAGLVRDAAVRELVEAKKQKQNPDVLDALQKNLDEAQSWLNELHKRLEADEAAEDAKEANGGQAATGGLLPGATGGLSTRADGPSAHDTGGKPPVPPDALPTPESFDGDEFINKDGIRYRSKMEPHHTKDGKTIFIKRFGPVPDDFKPGERKAEDSTDKRDATFHSRIVHGNRFAVYRIGPDGDLLEAEIRQIGLPKSEEDVKAIVQILESLFGEKRPVWAKSSQWKKIDDDRVELEIRLWNGSKPTFLLSEHDGRLRLKPIRRFFLSDGSQPFIPDGRPPQSGDAMEQDQFRLARALGKPVRLSFHDTPLRHVAQTLRNITQVDFLIDVQGLAEEGVTPETPVTIELSDITLRSALPLILKPLNLGYTTDDGVVAITSRQRAKGPLHVETYPIADLVVPVPHGNVVMNENGELAYESSPEEKQRTAARFDNLIDLITANVEPASWEHNGGPGVIRKSDATLRLVVRQTRDVHDELHELLTNLRRMRRSDREPLLVPDKINRKHFTPAETKSSDEKPGDDAKQGDNAASEWDKLVSEYNERIRQRNFAEALTIAKKLRELDPENVDAITMLYKAKVLLESTGQATQNRHSDAEAVVHSTSEIATGDKSPMPPADGFTSIRVRVEQAGTYYVDGYAASATGLASAIKEAMSDGDRTELVIQADQAAPFSAVVPVVEAAKEVGVEKIRFATRPRP